MLEALMVEGVMKDHESRDAGSLQRQGTTSANNRFRNERLSTVPRGTEICQMSKEVDSPSGKTLG